MSPSISLMYIEIYAHFKEFLEGLGDCIQEEFRKFLYPLFCIFFADLVRKCQRQEAKDFINHSLHALNKYERDLFTTFKEKLTEIFSYSGGCRYQIAINTLTHKYLTLYLSKIGNELLNAVVKAFLNIQVYDGPIRSVSETRSICGSVIGEAFPCDNKEAIYYGTDTQEFFMRIDREGEDLSLTPSLNRIPMPQLTQQEDAERQQAKAEIENCSTEPPSSAIMYSITNSHYSVTCVHISENGLMLAMGFYDGVVTVHALTESKLSTLKSPPDLKLIDKSQKFNLEILLDENNGKNIINLFGHSESVNCVRFASFKPFLLSASLDMTIRLWSIFTWTCLVVFEGHVSCIWHLDIAPNDFYFASASEDRTVQIWRTDTHRSLRILRGHYAGVNCVIFHPNSNYVATSSDDCTVRLWDLLDGKQVRLLTGHKSNIHPLEFSHCGRFLISGDRAQLLCFWDISNGMLVAQINPDVGVIHEISLCRLGQVLGVSGSAKQLVFINLPKIIEDYKNGFNSTVTELLIEKNDNYVVSRYKFKTNPVYTIYFSRENIPVAVEATECSGCSECTL